MLSDQFPELGSNSKSFGIGLKRPATVNMLAMAGLTTRSFKSGGSKREFVLTEMNIEVEEELLDLADFAA